MSSTQMLHRPIFGGVFGEGRYALATIPKVLNGLHAVDYMVIEPRDGSVLCVADCKARALAGARRLLRRSPEEPSVQRWHQAQLFPSLGVVPVASKRKRISRRRQAIFWRDEGRCHYCRTVLTLDGRWHVEHMVPRALDGDEAPRNLVASCTRCNTRKGTKTALEFIAGQGGAL